MHNSQACEHFMQLIGNVKELFWEDDILVQYEVEKWACDICGDTKHIIGENASELVDNTQ